MCQIFMLPPGVMPDKDDFAASAHVNSDGWGMAHTQGDGSIDYAFAKFDGVLKVDDQIDAAWEVMENFRDSKRLMHQRFTTVGKVSIGNCHPFPILDKDAQGDTLSLCLAHNGTLSKFRKPLEGVGTTDDSGVEEKDPSDTRNFALGLISPMAQLIDAQYGLSVEDGSIQLSEMMPFWEEAWVKHVLQVNVDSTSRVVFLDGNGNHYIVNEKTGKWLDSGIWVANTYSFNKNHRTPTTTSYWSGSTTYVGTNHKSPPPTPAQMAQSCQAARAEAAKDTATLVSKPVVDSEPTASDIVKGSNRKLFHPSLVQQKFSTIAGCASSDLLYLTTSALEELAEFYPEHILMLVQELQAIAFTQATELKALTARNKNQQNSIAEYQKQGSA